MKNSNLNGLYLATLATAICCMFSSTAISQTRNSIWLGAPVNQAYQLGQLNANLGQLNANLGRIRGTVFVVTNTNDSGPGSLRQAIAEANFNFGHDTITFDLANIGDQTVRQGQLVTVNAIELRITDSLTINGPGADLLTIGGNQASPGNRIFNIGSPRGEIMVNIIGMTISNAKLLESLGARASGGGIYASNCILNLYQTRVENNEAAQGGGIYHEGGTLNIAQSAITGNSAIYGGGIAVGPGSETYITSSLISRNSATATGSGISTRSSLTIINSTVTENSGPSTGAAIRSFYIDETATTGTPNETFLVNSTVSHNDGYGVDHTGASDGLMHSGVANVFSKMSLGNSIIANNGSAEMTDIAGMFDSLGTNLIGRADSGQGPISGVNGDQVGTPGNPIDPKLGVLEDNRGMVKTRALLAGSPAINRANNCVTLTVDNGSCMLFPLTTDQRLTPGLSRLVAGRVDIGAFESNFTDQPVNKDQCKNGGWQNFNNPRVFNNQGDCISFVNTGR